MPKKILIVDDSMFMRRVLKDNLPDTYEMVEAASGSEAIKAFEKERPDLTFLDIIMPGGEQEGINVLRCIKKKYPDAEVVMVTAVGQNSVIEECKEMGVKDYIIKPFDKKNIDHVVAKYLG